MPAFATFMKYQMLFLTNVQTLLTIYFVLAHLVL